LQDACIPRVIPDAEHGTFGEEKVLGHQDSGATIARKRVRLHETREKHSCFCIHAAFGRGDIRDDLMDCRPAVDRMPITLFSRLRARVSSSYAITWSVN
jgi:hypothetical protein